VLYDLPDPDGFGGPAPAWTADDTEPTSTFWGPARRVPVPGEIEDVHPGWRVDAGPLGRHEPAWQQR
jgi:hypothetical protein